LVIAKAKMSGKKAKMNGKGELIGWHDPDEHREWVRKHKSMALRDKRMSAKEAISRFVSNGDLIALGGFGHVRTPITLVHEVIRQRKRHLLAAGKTAVYDLDLLVGAGCTDRVEVAYAFGHELRGLAPASRRKVEGGECRVVAELSNATYQWRFLAGMMGIPYIPSRGLGGTDTLAYSSCKVEKDPFTGKRLTLLPACTPDVSMLHVPRCDIYGNCQIDGILVEDFELARASRRVLVATEELIPTDAIRKEPWKTAIPFYCVDAVVVEPWGVHPCEMPYLYYFDEEHIQEWLTKSKTEKGTKEYFDKYVYGTKNFGEYLELIGGEAKLQELRRLELIPESAQPRWSYQAEAKGYTPRELMVTAASNVLENERSVFVGTGMPMLASMLAQRTHAPDLLIVFEAGGISPQSPMLPVSVGDSRTFYHALAASSMHDTMAMAQAGYIEYCFLGGAQIDRYGNLNTTVIGPHTLPKVRLPGSGGANDLASFCHKTIILMEQDKRKFMDKLDFLTTPGYLTGPGAREEAGLPRNSGPYRVITQLGVYGFDENKEMMLLSLHPGVTIEEVKQSSSFPINIPEAEKVGRTPEPTLEELKILHELDPTGDVLK
jgi:3-oxoacid CoA-transferase subunit A/glutaconate CoA-transferase subunit A